MRTRTMASVLLATFLALTACGKENEEAEGNEADEAPSVATAAATDSAELAEQAVLAKEAKIVEADARATALNAVPGSAFEKVELEKEDGKLIYSYDLKLTGKDGIEEVHIDAITGAMVSRSHESAEDETKEAAKEKAGGADRAWTTDFEFERDQLTSSGRNPYFVLEPGSVLRLADATDTLVITVMPTTKLVDGVETRIVEERESSHGKLVEVSRNFFAISKRTNSVYYFGEEVDMYQNGRITSHEGAWLAGAKGARFGLMIPGLPLVGGKYYQELAPGTAMDRAEILGMSETVRVPAGEFRNVLRTLESSALEPGKEPKIYGRDVGLLQEGSLRLFSFGK